MDEQAFRFDLTPAEASYLEMLQHTFDPDTLSRYHDKRYAVQKQGEFLISWEYIDRHGHTKTESEIVTYMHKPL